jgi:hypothetical protein
MEISPPGKNPLSLQAPGRKAGPGEKEALHLNGPGETYSPGAGKFKSLLSDAKALFGGTAEDLEETRKLIERLNCTAVVTEHSAGWRGSFLEPLFPCEYTKISFDGGDRLLFLPLKSNVGSFHGLSTPLVISSDKGVLERLDSGKFNQSYALTVRQTDDGARTYITGFEPDIKSYDDKMNLLHEFDLSTLNPEYGSVHDFRCGSHANYAFILSRQNSADPKDFLAALDPMTNKPQWIKELKYGARKGIYEAPDGTVYASVGRKSKVYFEIYSKQGDYKGALELPAVPYDVTITNNGTIIMNLQQMGVRAINPSRLKPSRYTTAWEITDREYWNFQPSSDGKYLYAIDNGYSRNRMVKIDAATGHREWEQEDPSSHLLDYRVINDELYMLAEASKPDRAIMKKLDGGGKVLWEDSISASRIERWHGGSITPRGEFVFETRDDGCLHFMRPKKDGETEAGMQKDLRRFDNLMDEFREGLAKDRKVPAEQASQVEDFDQFVIIDGLKLDKRRLNKLA